MTYISRIEPIEVRDITEFTVTYIDQMVLIVDRTTYPNCCPSCFKNDILHINVDCGIDRCLCLACGGAFDFNQLEEELEHAERHKLLYKYYEELVKDWFDHEEWAEQRGTLLDLEQWAGQQAVQLDHKRH